MASLGDGSDHVLFKADVLRILDAMEALLKRCRDGVVDGVVGARVLVGVAAAGARCGSSGGVGTSLHLHGRQW